MRVEGWVIREEFYLRYHPSMSNYEFLKRFGAALLQNDPPASCKN